MRIEGALDKGMEAKNVTVIWDDSKEIHVARAAGVKVEKSKKTDPVGSCKTLQRHWLLFQVRREASGLY